MAGNRPVADIMSDYHLEAQAHQYGYRKRQNTDPDASDLDRRIAAAGMQIMKLALEGKPTQALEERLQGLQGELRRHSEHLGEQEYICDSCQDTGRVRGEYCRCLRRRIYLEHCGAQDPLKAPHSLQTLTTDIYSTEAAPPYGASPRDYAEMALKVSRSFVEHLPDPPRGLVFLGLPGLGKTWFVSAIAKQAALEGHDVAFFHAADLFDLYYRKRRGMAVDTSFLETAGLLIVDDLGTEPMTANVTIESLLRILTLRQTRGLPSVFASNVTDLQGRYGERISSRLLSQTSFDTLPLIGRDLRSPVDLFHAKQDWGTEKTQQNRPGYRKTASTQSKDTSVSSIRFHGPGGTGKASRRHAE